MKEKIKEEKNIEFIIRETRIKTAKAIFDDLEKGETDKCGMVGYHFFKGDFDDIKKKWCD
jgi:hypothetical protein